MNKYFYPIYKMKLKPWIKWWILKRLNGSGESTLKAITISSGTLKKVDTTKPLSIKEYYGNTIQNGIPTPEAPIEIQTISGENTFTINSNNYIVNLGNIELCKIGEHQDRIYKENDKWYIEKQVGKVVLNGSENITTNPNGTNSFYVPISDTVYKDGTTINIASNYFKGISYNDRVITGNNTIYVEAYQNFITVRNTTFSSLENFKTWLGTNNTTVYYVLATPTIEEIINTNLISELNALYEFYVQSSTVSISNDSEIPFEFLLEYYMKG